MARSRFLLRAAITLSSPVFSAVLAGINFQPLSKAAIPNSPSTKGARFRRFLEKTGEERDSMPVRAKEPASQDERKLTPRGFSSARCRCPPDKKAAHVSSARPLEVYGSLA